VVSLLDPSVESSYRYVVLRDAWGVVVSDDQAQAQGPEEFSGHFRTFPVMLEDIPRMYDYMVVVRFPDVTRTTPPKAASKLKLRGAKKTKAAAVWNTEVRVGRTAGPTQPARFKLTVHEDPKVEARKVARAEAVAAAAALAAEEEAAIAAGVDMGLSELKMRLGGLGQDKEEDKPIESMFESTGLLDTEDERLIDIALTVSSAVDWIVAGDATAAAETRVRVVPSGPTLAYMRRCRAGLFERAKELQRKRGAVAAMLEAETGEDAVDEAAGVAGVGGVAGAGAGAGVADEPDDDDEDEDEEEDKKDDISALGSEAAGDARPTTAPKKGFKSFAKTKPSPTLIHSPNRPASPALLGAAGDEITEGEEDIEEDPEVDVFDTTEVYSFGHAGSWLSTDFLRLLPGVYYIYGDVRFDLTMAEMRTGLKVHADPTDAPWKEDANYGTPSVWLEASSACRIDLEVVSPEESATLPEALKLPPPPDRPPVVIAADEAVTNEEIEGYLKRLRKARKLGDPKVIDKAQGKVDTALAAAREALRVEREEAARLADEAMLREIEASDRPPVDVADIEVTAAVWPFMAEVQSEAAARGLVVKMASLRSEAEYLAAQFVEAAQQLKAAKHRMKGAMKGATVMLRVPE
jgi:hypothetical protein